MIIIGDVHGHIGAFKLLLERAKGQEVFQVGDLGLGFGDVPAFSENCRFIRGNHDSPDLARAHPNYAGEFGYDEEHKLFFMGGAWSIDQKYRKEDVSWWKDEELSAAQIKEAQELYERSKPKIVITHDCPDEVRNKILAKQQYILGVGYVKPQIFPTRTGQALQAMFEKHKPELWFFGHYHVDKIIELKNVKFICLNELSRYELKFE